LRELSLTGRAIDLADLADSPQLAGLRSLNARGLWDKDGVTLGRLLSLPQLAGLKALRLPSNNLGSRGFQDLTRSDRLTALEELDLSSLGRHERYNRDPVIRSAGIADLMAWAGEARLHALTLNANDVRRDGLRALLRSPHAGLLKELSVRDCGLDGAAMGELASALPELRLEALDLGENVLQDLGAEYVATAPCLSELKSLHLDRCEIPAAGALQFAKKATFLGSLKQLDVGYNHFGPAGLAELLGRNSPSLHTLRIRDNDLHSNGAQLLADSPASDALLEIDLTRNGLGPAGARALAKSAHLGGLLALWLADNSIDEESAVALAASPLGKRLAALGLEALPSDDDANEYRNEYEYDFEAEDDFAY
jgi:hypothetical protein